MTKSKKGEFTVICCLFLVIIVVFSGCYINSSTDYKEKCLNYNDYYDNVGYCEVYEIMTPTKCIRDFNKYKGTYIEYDCYKYERVTKKATEQNTKIDESQSKEHLYTFKCDENMDRLFEKYDCDYETKGMVIANHIGQFFKKFF